MNGLASHETAPSPYNYDAVVVLGGGLHQSTSGDFHPTDYRHGDDFGMLGAGARMVAATELYLNGEANHFVFATGVTQKNQEKFGPDVPTEAQVYKEKFLRGLAGLRKRSDYSERMAGLEEPKVDLEDRSFNTASNVTEVLGIIREQDLSRVAIVSSDYHIPRIKAWYENALRESGETEALDISFIPAETYVKASQPGKYDAVIDEYYQTPAARERAKNEQKGLVALHAGTIVKTEFQTTPTDHRPAGQ